MAGDAANQPPDAAVAPPEATSNSAKLAASLANYFPVWVAIACVAAVLHPPSFLWFKKDYVTAGLALTMLAMGTTLSLEVSLVPRQMSAQFQP